MTLAVCSHRRLPFQPFARRCMSTAAKKGPSAPQVAASSSAPPPAKKVLSHKSLPPPKMRALISLYHQADKWVTPETLYERIDKTFVPNSEKNPLLALQTYTKPSFEGVTLANLKDAQRARATAPRMAQLEHDFSQKRRAGVASTESANWSAEYKWRREKMVFEALYGVEITSDDGAQEVLPGLEVLEETKGSLKKHRRDDKEDTHVGDLL